MAAHWLVAAAGFVQMHTCSVSGRLVAKKLSTFLFVSLHQRFVNTVPKSWCTVQDWPQSSPKNTHVYRLVPAVSLSCCVVQVLWYWNLSPVPLQARPVKINELDSTFLRVVIDIGRVAIPMGKVYFFLHFQHGPTDLSHHVPHGAVVVGRQIPHEASHRNGRQLLWTDDQPLTLFKPNKVQSWKAFRTHRRQSMVYHRLQNVPQHGEGIRGRFQHDRPGQMSGIKP